MRRRPRPLRRPRGRPGHITKTGRQSPPPPPTPTCGGGNPTTGGKTLTNRGSLTGRIFRNFGNPPLGHEALLPNCRGNRIGATHPGRGRHTVLSDRAMKQRILGYRTPPCHKRPVIATQSSDRGTLSDRGGGVRTAAAVTPVAGVAYGTPTPQGRARQP